MLNFDEPRFISIQSGAVGLAAPLDRKVGELLADGRENLYFLGAGGAGVLMLPAAQLLERSGAFPVHLQHAAEIVAMGAADLGEKSIVVIPSLSGTTKESVEVLEYAQARGAHVIALTGHADSPVADQADSNFTNFAADDTSSESFFLQSLLLVLSVMRARGRCDRHAETVAQLATLPELLLEVKRAFEPRAAELAEAFRDEPFHIITGAGSTWAEAWYYGTCILEEMQWIRTRPIHSSDFFHGTLELVEPGVSVVVFKGEDAARPLAERVEAFAPTVTEKVTVLDTADFDLPGIDAEVRALISPVLLATVLERLSAHLEVLRDHPLTTRRYYRRVEY
ncbi:MAG: SIS domain-containing protein [Actinobacteria bacterium]|nr:SIS domain-containing protein [Actinomycetota bacterium]